MATSPPTGWTNNADRLHKDYYWANKAGTVADDLRANYGLTNITPIWTPSPDRGGVLFVFQANDTNNNPAYYLWNGLEDTVALFVQTTLQGIKAQIDAGQGTLRNVTFSDVPGAAPGG